MIVETLDGDEAVHEILQTIREAVAGGLTDLEVRLRARVLVRLPLGGAASLAACLHVGRLLALLGCRTNYHSLI